MHTQKATKAQHFFISRWLHTDENIITNDIFNSCPFKLHTLGKNMKTTNGSKTPQKWNCETFCHLAGICDNQMSNVRFVGVDARVDVLDTREHFSIFPDKRVAQRPSNLDSRPPVNSPGGVAQGHFSSLPRACCLLVSHCFLTLFLTFGCWLFWTDLFYCQSSVTCDLGWGGRGLISAVFALAHSSDC